MRAHRHSCPCALLSLTRVSSSQLVTAPLFMLVFLWVQRNEPPAAAADVSLQSAVSSPSFDGSTAGEKSHLRVRLLPAEGSAFGGMCARITSHDNTGLVALCVCVSLSRSLPSPRKLSAVDRDSVSGYPQRARSAVPSRVTLPPQRNMRCFRVLRFYALQVPHPCRCTCRCPRQCLPHSLQPCTCSSTSYR